MVRSMMSQTTLPKSFWDYALESAARILNMVPNKKVEKTPYEIWHGHAPKLSYLKETMGYSFYNPSKNKVLVARNAKFFESNLIDQEAKDDQEIDEPQSDINPIRRSTRTKRAPDRMCLYIDAEEHELGDLDNDVSELVELPPNAKTVGHKWLFKKKTDMDGAVHTFKSRLVAKGFTQTYEVDYEICNTPKNACRSRSTFGGVTS
ncbi:retrotransposon protein, putative, ty1-copia subclass [Tanacetum coccineum]